MNIVEPKVEYWEQKDPIDHVARAAHVCYQSPDKGHEANEKFYNALISSNHVSMLRHESRYYIVIMSKMDIYGDDGYLCDYFFDGRYDSCPYINIKKNDDGWYVSTNANFLLDNKHAASLLTKWEVTPEEFKKVCPELMRFTMCCTSSIDITREFNRVSPNNISEESTRYVNYSKDKFGNSINIGDFIGWEPGSNWNGDMLQACSALLKYEDIDGILTSDQCFNAVFKFSEYMYMQLIKLGVKPEQARKVLPLATKSTVIYTYSVKEWESILQKRLLNMTGKAHPDAIKLAELIYQELQKLGYKFNENNELVCESQKE